MLSFHTTTLLDPSTTSTSHHEDDSDQEDMHTITDKGIACASECCTNICNEQGLTLFQPKDSSTIERTRWRQGQKSSLFSPNWYVTYPWMTLCITRVRAFCVFCCYCVRKGLSLVKKEDAFVTSGFDNWKKPHERFTQHVQSDLHKECILKVELLKQDSVAALLNEQAKGWAETAPRSVTKAVIFFAIPVEAGISSKRSWQPWG